MNTMINRIANSILELIGNTPLVRVNQIIKAESAAIYAKLEYFNPGGSVKDRIALSMIEDAERQGLLKKGSTVIEPTSGNTGIGIAMVCAVKQYRCILVMPESMSLERIYILQSFCAEVVLSPATEGMIGAIKKAEELHTEIKNSIMLRQFENPANPKAHRERTAMEILTALDGKIDVFVAGVGTGGTLTGVGEVLKQHLPSVRVIAVEPKSSAVLSGEKPGPHKIQGIGAGFIPPVLNKNIIDDIIKVSDNEAYAMSQRLAHEEGLFVGISAGAAMWAAVKLAESLRSDKTVVTVLPDTGERYFSVSQYYKL